MNRLSALAFLMLFSFGLSAQARDLFCSKVFRPLTDFELSMTDLVDRNLYQIRDEQVEQVSASNMQFVNERVIDSLTALEPRFHGPAPLKRKDAQRLLRSVTKKPVVENQYLYEREDADIGYCFGRATCAHLQSLKRGFNKDQIKKVFVVGPMVTGSSHWAYHVTTIVRDRTGDWWAIDNFTPEVMKVRDWYHYMLTMSEDGKLAFYVTDPQKFGAMGGRYERFEMGLDGSRDQDYYKGYFQDLMQSMRKKKTN